MAAFPQNTFSICASSPVLFTILADPACQPGSVTTTRSMQGPTGCKDNGDSGKIVATSGKIVVNGAR